MPSCLGNLRSESMFRRRNSRRSLLGISDQARALASAPAGSTGKWSLAQVCRHLALSIEMTLSNTPEIIGSNDATVRRGFRAALRRWIYRRITLTFGYIPPGVPVPGKAHPGDHADLPSELAHLEAAARRFEAAMGESARVWPGQRYMGWLNAGQWHRFHYVHAAHHFAYFRCRPAG